MPPTTLVLWDVDHTLMDSGGVGSEVYASAFEKVTGRPLEQMADVFGRTEPVIFRETLQANGIEDFRGSVRPVRPGAGARIRRARHRDAPARPCPARSC